MTSCVPHIRALYRPRPRSLRAGFTLLEMLVVILIVGVLTASATLTLLHSNRAATFNDVLRRLEYIDAVSRHSARRAGCSQEIVFDLDKGAITTRQLDSESPAAFGEGTASNVSTADAVDWVQQMHLPPGIHIDRIWMNDPRRPVTDSDLQRMGTENDHGIVSIPCSNDGYTPTYGLELSAADGRTCCLVVAGLTGQISEGLDRNQIRSFFVATTKEPKTS